MMTQQRLKTLQDKNREFPICIMYTWYYIVYVSWYTYVGVVYKYILC